jgi:hypothetical protein
LNERSEFLGVRGFAPALNFQRLEYRVVQSPALQGTLARAIMGRLMGNRCGLGHEEKVARWRFE